MRTRRTKNQIEKDRYNSEVDSYQWYVVNLDTNRAETGFEFKEDAIDLLNDYENPKKYKVVSKRTLKIMGIENPNASFKYVDGGYTDLSKEKPQVINEGKNFKDEVKIPEIDIEKVKTINFNLDNNKILSLEDTIRVLKQLYDKGSINAYEEVKILYLDNSNKVIGVYTHSKGGVTGTVVDVEMICALALKCLARGVIMSHNHPSGNLKFSDADIKVTKELKNALNLFKIGLLDSVIITEFGYESMSNLGILANGGSLSKFNNGGFVNWAKYPTKKVKGLYEIKGDEINRKVNIVFFERYDDDLYSLYPLDKDKNLFKEILVKSTALNSLDKGVTVQGETNQGKKVSIKRISNQDFSYATGGGVGLIGNQSRIDMNKNGKIDADDFKLLRSSMNGAWRKEHKYVNHDEDYEVRYAKPIPNRTGYKGNRKFATGG